uniref:Uncharacterized protein n=1 Tax=Pyricularia oryzae (strain 70-15 / ATCC MYA-4617 / FGSC 8958) TaxID=242507 RepID=Q2KG17_PYRO7|nr:hypothetical protein MGCH7_ch7g518 [Pyricularia oryzae 70-15]
MQASHQSQS